MRKKTAEEIKNIIYNSLITLLKNKKMEKTRFHEFTASELNTLAINLNTLTDINLEGLKKELKKEIELKAESKYRHELEYINNSIKKFKERKHALELYLKIYAEKPTDL